MGDREKRDNEEKFEGRTKWKRAISPGYVDGVRSAGRAGSLGARGQRYEGVDDDVRRRHVNHRMAEHVCPAFVNKINP